MGYTKSPPEVAGKMLPLYVSSIRSNELAWYNTLGNKRKVALNGND